MLGSHQSSCTVTSCAILSSSYETECYSFDYLSYRQFYSKESVLCHPVYGEIFKYLIGEGGAGWWGGWGWLGVAESRWMEWVGLSWVAGEVEWVGLEWGMEWLRISTSLTMFALSSKVVLWSKILQWWDGPQDKKKCLGCSLPSSLETECQVLISREMINLQWEARCELACSSYVHETKTLQ